MKRLVCITAAVLAVFFVSCAGMGSAPADQVVPAKPPVAGEKNETASGLPAPIATKEAPSSAKSLDAEIAAEASPSRGESAGAAADFLAPVPAPEPALRAESAAPKPAPGMAWASGPESVPKSVPTASGLKAGFSDDNAQFNYFVDFLAKYDDVPHFAYDISERLTLRILDASGKPAANAAVSVSAGGTLLAKGLSYADGLFRFYPAALDAKASDFDFQVKAGQYSARARVSRDGARLVELKLQGSRTIPSPLPLDVVFVMDTTGSMGEEISRLTSTIEIIYANLNELKPRPLVRFGLVLYKDRGDEYITQVVPLTEDLDAFQKELEQVSADGGGDGPEDLESALDDTVNAIDWNEGGLRMAFVVTDAEPHLDYGREYTYVDAANDARSKAIKLFTIGTGGLPLEGEYILRQISQLTDSRYIFLTYGEDGESTGGKEGSVSHHTGANFQTDKLEAIIIRFVREEVSHLSDSPLTSGEDFYTAQRVGDESRDETMDKLFVEAMGNLADYSTYHITKDTPCVVMPLTPSDASLAASAEYFGERLAMASTVAERWKPVERKDLQKILAELELQLSGLADEGSAAKVGQVLGADIMVAGTLYKRAERYELFLKLLRVSTAEVLAVTRAKIDLDLGL
jgi:Mg-chelatase subunit ChlD